MIVLLTKKLTLLAFLLCISFSSFSQFTYIGGGLSHNKMVLDKGSYTTNTSLSTVEFNIGAMYRPMQNFSIGVGISIPVYQKNEFGFQNPPNTDLHEINNFNGAYEPQVLDYTFKQSPTTSIQARIFFESRLNSYIDFRMSISSIEESFKMKRAYLPDVEEINVEYTRTHSMVTPGFTIGVMPQFNSFYVDLNLGLNIIQFGRAGFSYDVSYEKNFPTESGSYVTFASQAEGNKLIWSKRIGFGYYF